MYSNLSKFHFYRNLAYWGNPTGVKNIWSLQNGVYLGSRNSGNVDFNLKIIMLRN